MDAEQLTSPVVGIEERDRVAQPARAPHSPTGIPLGLEVAVLVGELVEGEQRHAHHLAADELQARMALPELTQALLLVTATMGHHDLDARHGRGGMQIVEQSPELTQLERRHPMWLLKQTRVDGEIRAPGDSQLAHRHR